MMHGYQVFLDIHTDAELLGGADDHADSALVNCLKQPCALPFGFCFVNKGDLVTRNAQISEIFLQFIIDIEALFRCADIRENNL